MKFNKKFLAASMAAATLVAAGAIASAEDLPTLVPELTVNESAKTADIVFKIKNLHYTQGEYDDQMYVEAAVSIINIDGFVTDDAKTSKLNARTLGAWADKYFTDGLTGYGAGITEDKTCFSYSGGDATPAAYKSKPVSPDGTFVLFTLHDLPLTDDAFNNGFTVAPETIDDGFSIVTFNEYMGEPEFEEMYAAVSTNYGVSGAIQALVETATWPGKQPEPEYTPKWTGDSATQEKYQDATYAGVFTGDEGDKATAFKTDVKTAAEDAYNALVWKVNSAGTSKFAAQQFGTVAGGGTTKFGLAVGGLENQMATAGVAWANR